MLHTATVYPRTLAILRQLMQSPAFNAFNLVGGTALSLQIGHRISIDLDMFTTENVENNYLISELSKLGNLEILVDKPPFLQTSLDDVKLDFLKYPYPIINEFVELEGIRLVNIENITIMKLIAIARRGVKKDFFDLYFLLQIYTLDEIIAIFKLKVPNVDLFHIIKSLTYFDDANIDADPKMLQKVTWATVKKTIIHVSQNYLKTLK